MTRVARLPAARASSRNPVSVKDKQRLRLWLKLLRTSRGIEVYFAVTVLYFVSAFAVNRIAHFVEGRVQVPGMIGGK